MDFLGYLEKVCRSLLTRTALIYWLLIYETSNMKPRGSCLILYILCNMTKSSIWDSPGQDWLDLLFILSKELLWPQSSKGFLSWTGAYWFSWSPSTIRTLCQMLVSSLIMRIMRCIRIFFFWIKLSLASLD